MSRLLCGEAGTAAVTLPPHLQPKPSRILQIQVEPWEPDPLELAARDCERSSRLAEWKRALHVAPERQTESNSTCSTKFPTSSVDDLSEDCSRSHTRQWCGTSSLDSNAPMTGNASTTRGVSFRELGDSSNPSPLFFEYMSPLASQPGQELTPSRASSAKALGQGAERSRDAIEPVHDSSSVRDGTLGARAERSFSDPARPVRSMRCRSARSQSDLHRSDTTSTHGVKPRARSFGRRSSSAISLHSTELEAERSFEKYTSQPALSRLCDPKYYTGRQRKRFDEGFGHGKVTDDLGESGVHGYKSEIYLFPRSSTSPRRPQRSSARSPSPVVGEAVDHLAPLKVVLVFRNADQFHEGERVVIHRHIRTLSALYKRLTEVLKPYCPINELYNAEFVRVGRVDELEHGEKYLACEGQGPTSKRHLLTKFLTAPSRIH